MNSTCIGVDLKTLASHDLPALVWPVTIRFSCVRSQSRWASATVLRRWKSDGAAKSMSSMQASGKRSPAEASWFPTRLSARMEAERKRFSGHLDIGSMSFGSAAIRAATVMLLAAVGPSRQFTVRSQAPASGSCKCASRLRVFR